MERVIELKKELVDNVVAWFSEEFEIDKKTFISVPMNYKAIAIIDEKVAFRIEPCSKENLCKKIDKDLNGKKVRFVYAISNSIPQMAWGFGNIQVNNDRLKEAYRVGANGKYIVEIADYVKLIKAYPNVDRITVDDIRDKTITIIKMVGVPILSKCFVNTYTSVFEIDSKLQDIRNDMKSALLDEQLFKNIGLKVIDVTVEKIFVPEEDIEQIRNRINDNNQNQTDISYSKIENLKNEIIQSMQDSGILNSEIDKLRNEIARIAQNQNPSVDYDEIEKLKDELMQIKNRDNKVNISPILNELAKIKTELSNAQAKQHSSDNYIKELEATISGLENKINTKMDRQLVDIKEMLENTLDEQNQNTLPIYDKAKEEAINNLELTTDLLIEKAFDEESFAIPASVIYTNVEKTLIEKFNLYHKDKAFYMTNEEFDELANQVSVNGKYIFRDVYKKRYAPFDDNYVEMPVEFRFIKAGMTTENALRAARYWTLLNKFRHISDENSFKLKKALSEQHLTEDEFLKNVLKFYREQGIFVKD